MANGVLVAVVKAIDDLLEEDQGLFLWQATTLHQIVKKLSTLHKLQDQVQLSLTLIHLVQHHHIRVANELHQGDFSKRCVSEEISQKKSKISSIGKESTKEEDEDRRTKEVRR